LKALKDAIEADYFFEMLIDELPMWGYIGEVSDLLLLYDLLIPNTLTSYI
jgi:hypothetical protein